MIMKEFAKIFLVAVLLVTISACERQNCTNVVCPAGQNCNGGRCYCPDGYEGTDCATLASAKFVTPYYFNVSENCFGSNPPFGGSNYTLTMYPETDARFVRIQGLLNGYCTDLIATIRTDASNQGSILEIPTQSNNCGGITVGGDGVWHPENNTIIFNLQITANGTYNCQYTCYRQQ